MRRRLFCQVSIVLVLLCIPATTSAELVVHWAFEDGAGTTASDSSGNGYDGTFVGTPQWVEGRLGGGLHFDGDAATSSVVFKLPGGASVWASGTIAIWVKPDSLGQDQYSSCFTNYNPNSAGIQLDVDGGNPGNWRLNPGGQFFGPATTEWTHLALTFENGVGTFYYDGVEATTADLSDSQRTFNEFAVGLNRNHTNWLAGTIDELRVYDDALTASEIQAIMFSAAGKLPRARRPEPADGQMYGQTWATLRWGAGDGAVSHDLYLGTSFDDVSAGAGGTLVGNLTATQQVIGFFGFPAPDGLRPGTTYYWRVDEVNNADPNSPWKGDVWSFWIPPRHTYDPAPADGVEFVKTDAAINWAPGFRGVFGQLYFGTDPAEVEAGTGGTAKGTVVGTTYNPGALEEAKTYYWRVDQFDGSATHKGDVWSFTTVPVIAVTDPDLLGWWTLDEGEGATAVDWSGHAGHGSLIGGPQWVDGFQGMALEFDGRGQYVDCGDEAGAGVTADFTIAAWARLAPGNAGHYGGIAGKLTRVGGADYFGFAIVRYNSNVFRLWVADGDSAQINGYASSDMTYTDTEWHHVAGVREGRTNMLYVDGIRQNETTMTDFVPSTDFFHIGRQYAHLDDRYFGGRIDDVRVYDKVLTADQIAQVMRGDATLAGDPAPGRDAVIDIRDVSSLTWSAGSAAVSHDVYLGTDRDAVAGADKNAPQFKGNQAGTSLSLAGLVEFGGGDYYWRVDENRSDGTVKAGTVWKFTAPNYLPVDEFEDYDAGNKEIWWSWKDGLGYPARDGIPAYPGNGTGAEVGDPNSPTYMERVIVPDGGQSMPLWYDNNKLGFAKYSEVEFTVPSDKRDWTAEGVNTLSLWFRGDSTNAADPLYVAVAGTAVVYHDDAGAAQAGRWKQWDIPLQAFADKGVDLTRVDKIAIGLGTRGNTTVPGGSGKIYIDNLRLVRSTP